MLSVNSVFQTGVKATVFVLVFAIVAMAVGIDLSRNVMGHKRKFIFFRTFNWLTMGMSYACLFFARYNWSAINIAPVHAALDISKSQYGTIITAGLWSYALAAIVNGSVVDKIGVRKGIMIGCFGSGALNVIIGIMFFFHPKGPYWLPLYWVLVSINNIFQSFGSLAIVKIGAYWYHVRERGVYSGCFGVIVGFGFFLAFNVNQMISAYIPWQWCFIIPGAANLVMATADYFIVRATPEDAGFPAIEEVDAKTGEKVHHEATGQSFVVSLKHVVTQKIFLVLAPLEFCLGWCRDGVLTWYTGMMLDVFNINKSSAQLQLASGIVTIGAMFGSLGAGVISDTLFKSRRPPVAFIFMAGLIVSIFLIMICPEVWIMAFLVGISSIFFSAVHGITLSTCAMDFAGSGSTGLAVGLLDGIQKFGSGFQAIILPEIIKYGNKYVKVFHYEHWGYRLYAAAMIPMAIIGTLCLLSILFKKPPTASQIGDEEEALLTATDAEEGELLDSGVAYHEESNDGLLE
ncbi:Major facilitator superfamily [Carpediemonas membranifera]|uniref:Major facilitator superfamily n=1 Tax=Carpediemonas membranifera TaxID=201153 RepID=A0A8J6B9F1_9EUKA|nr:Major facilitator superfamily [Carpediemonas membranifera]|eukprot:KAG9395939.1 Major facilitator superfamily [Carpediemonas membranifera]